MSSINIIYSGLLDLPVCTSEKCGHALEDDGIKRHMRGSHKTSSSDEIDHIERLIEQEQECAKKEGDNFCNTRAKYLETTASEFTSGPPLYAIEVLPVQDCFKCPGCGYIAPKQDSVRKHMSATTSCSGLASQEIHPVKSQTIFGGNKRKFFEVIDDSDPTRGSCILSMAMKKLQGSKPAESSLQAANISLMDAFLSIMRFDRHLKMCDLTMDKAYNLTNVGDSGKRSSFRNLVSAYHKCAFDITEKKVYIKSHTFMDSGLSLAVEKKTVEHYDARMSRLIAFVFNCCTDGHHLRTHFPQDFIAGVNALSKMLSAPSQLSTFRQLHSLLYSLFFSPVHDENDGLMLFISCCSVITSTDKQSFRYANASDLSPMIAALKHFARCIVVMEIYKFGEKDTTAAWAKIEKATGSNSDTGIHFAQHCLSVCNRIRNGETHKARFTLCPKHDLCAVIDGVELSLEQLGTKMKELQKRAWTLLNSKLLKGLELTEHFWASSAQMQDCLMDLTPAYWFGSHSANRNVLDYWSNALLQRYRPLLLHADNTLNRKCATGFLEKCEELQGLLYVLLQTCSGAPARASELGIVRVCNTAIGPRNIFFNAGHLFTVIAYHKGRTMQEGVGRPVVRYPDRVTAGLLMVYLIVVRPLEATVVQLLLSDCQGGQKEGIAQNPVPPAPKSPTSPGTTHRDYLFVSRGNPAGVDRLRHCFEKSLKSLGIPMCTSQYRQYHSGVVKNLLGFEDTDWDQSGRKESGTTMLHKQAGHTEKTAHQIYGVSSLDMRKLTGTEMEAFRVASMTWHHAIGMEHGQPCPAEDAASQSASLTADKPVVVNDLGDVIVRLERLEQTIRNYFKRETKRLRSTPEPDLENLSEPPQKRVCRDPRIPSNVKKQMRSFLGKQDAEFKSTEQEIAVQYCIKAPKDAVIVLPTGGGKSLTFMLSAYVLPEKVIVVIVPLVALQQDLIRRCSEVGLQASLWHSRDVAGARIIIASAEHIPSKGYQAFIREMSVMGKLHAIFIDEGHLVLLWRKFREAMIVLHKFIRPEPVKVPVITLTATAPPSIETSIAEACGMSNWTTIRKHTSRSNIRYTVMDVTKEDMFRQVDRNLCVLYKQYDTPSCRAIVYVRTRADCDSLRETLTHLSPHIPCFKYHAGMSAEEREVMQRGWKDTSDGKAHVMVATAAFGCGIDIPTVRIVIHAGQPSTLTEFIQESGRGGRDCKPASSIVLNSSGSVDRIPVQEDRVPFDEYEKRPEVEVSKWNESMFGTVEGLTENTTACRRWLLDNFVDGASSHHTCQERGMELCDICDAGNVSGDNSHSSPHAFTQPLGRENDRGSGVTGSGSHTTTATAEEIKEDYGSRITEYFCPVCTLEKRTIVEHREGSDERNWPCYRKRCLRCALIGHNVKSCQTFRSADRGCVACGFRMMDGIVFHKNQEYGHRTCHIKKIMTAAVLCWSNPLIRQTMHKEIEGIESLKTVPQFTKWLRGDPVPLNGTRQEGLKSFTPWLFNYIGMPLVSK